MAPSRSAPVELDLGRVLELLRTRITGALGRTVFAVVLITERQRCWTLEALVQFWLAVILRAPQALSQALYETLEGAEPLFLHVQASLEAFSQRCQTLRPAPAGHPGSVRPGRAPLYQRFPAVCIVDGSRLAAIAHHLKLLWAVIRVGALSVIVCERAPCPASPGPLGCAEHPPSHHGARD